MTELRLSGVERTYPGAVPVRALHDVDLVIRQGEFVAIEGPSGAGKSTLLNVLAVLDRPTAGRYEIDGHDVAALNDAAASRLRCRTFGFVFQSFHLLGRRTALDNVMLGLTYHGIDPDEARRRSQEALDFVGLADRADFRVDLLSGGERQRVAIARAVCSSAPVLLADEPTGNLDSRSSQIVMDILENLNARGVTVVVVTHDPDVAARTRRRIRVEDGRVTERPPATPGAGHSTHPLPSARSPQAAAPSGADRPSHVTLRSMAHDVLSSLRSDPGRTARLMAVVVVSVMLALTTIGLAQTAQYQVSAAFDAQRNRRVAVGGTTGTDTSAQVARALVSASTPEALGRVRAIPGVEAVMAVSVNGETEVTTGPMSETVSVRLFGIDSVPTNAALLSVRGTQGQPVLLEEGQALVGSAAASKIRLGPLDASPTIWVEGIPFEVVGIVDAAGMRDELTGGVITNLDEASATVAPESTGLEIRTSAGAAEQVAEVAAVAWSPELADAMTTIAPPDPRGLRDSIEGSVQTVLLTLTVVAALAALASLSNATSTAVRSRQGELALRRAIGARRKHLRLIVCLESVVIGLAGGGLGVVGSVMAILVVTIIQRWQPVVDPWILPMGVGAGVVAGWLGSVAAAHRAGAIQPAAALR